MSVRVRFAPSPTGYLHIGGARTCLYNYLFAKKEGGKLILRIEDTDLERSKREFEDSQISDLKWFGMDYDEGPGKPGKYGPYRQSERLDIYKEYAHRLLEEGNAFYCFCTEEELEEMKEKAIREGRDPLYEGPWKDFPLDEAKKKVDAGEKAVIRFRVPDKDYVLKDEVRGEVRFPKGMVGDFVILRSNGMPTYNFCCVIDDALMNISHVIRGEDHLNNSLRQLMIYEAFNFELPVFAHVSLLIGEDRQKLSKRHGATSVNQYRQQGYFSEALGNYLCLLGWSHPEEKDIFSPKEIVELFSINRFSKSAALYDFKKLDWVNGQHLKEIEVVELVDMVKNYVSDVFKENESSAWIEEFISLHQEKVQTVLEFRSFYDSIKSESVILGEAEKDVLAWETSSVIIDYLDSQLQKSSDVYIGIDEVNLWMSELKSAFKVKGKNLFMGLRVCLTGACHGADLKRLLPLTKRDTIKKRLASIKSLC